MKRTKGRKYMGRNVKKFSAIFVKSLVNPAFFLYNNKHIDRKNRKFGTEKNVKFRLDRTGKIFRNYSFFTASIRYNEIIDQ